MTSTTEDTAHLELMKRITETERKHFNQDPDPAHMRARVLEHYAEQLKRSRNREELLDFANAVDYFAGSELGVGVAETLSTVTFMLRRIARHDVGGITQGAVCENAALIFKHVASQLRSRA